MKKPSFALLLISGIMLSGTLLTSIGNKHMAWYNPATWTPVDNIQNKLGGAINSVSGPRPGAQPNAWGGNTSTAYSSSPAPASSAPASPLGPTSPTNTTSEYYYPSGTYGSGSGYAAVPTSDPATQAYYNHQAALLQGQLGQLDQTQNVGAQNLQNTYNQQYNRLGEQYGVAQRDYHTGVQDTQQGYQTARDTAATQARAKLSALQRLLGIGGSGVSSASQDAAPLAVATNATQEIAPVQTAYAQNRRNQDTNLEDTTRSYKNNQADLGQQLYSQQNALSQQVAQSRANLLSQIADATYKSQLAGGAGYAAAQAGMNGYDGQINNLLAQITQLGNQWQNPVLKTGDVSYTAPTLAQYLLGQQSSVNQSNPGGDSVNPLFVPLLGKKEDQLALA